MKTCSRCKALKQLDAFGRNKRRKDGHQGWCRECTKEHARVNRDKAAARNRKYAATEKGKATRAKIQREGRRRNRDMNTEQYQGERLKAREAAKTYREAHPNVIRLREVKSQPCTDCGETYPPGVMDLDHVRGKKDFAVNVSTVVRPFCTPEVLEAELSKCDVRCANCHRLRHHFERTKSAGMECENLKHSLFQLCLSYLAEHGYSEATLRDIWGAFWRVDEHLSKSPDLATLVEQGYEDLY